MTNSKMTRKALFTSIMALMLCFAMLTGTTFAWFTDQETSANNKIIAGNLDIEMYNALTADDDQYLIGADTRLFEGIKLEPGAVVYENITVANKGNLALKYQLSVNFTDGGLADALKVGVIDGGVNTTDREAVKRAVTTWMPIANFVESGELFADDSDATTTEKTTETYGIVIYWEPSDNDNKFNGNDKNATKNFSVDFGVTLFATQLMAEEDAFGKDYDDGAFIPVAPETIPTEGEALVLNGSKESNVTVTVPATVLTGLKDNNVTSLSIAASKPVVDATSKTVTFSTIELQDQDGNEVDLSNANAKVTVTLPVGNAFANGEQVEVYHDGSFVTYAIVADGKISYEVSHFCEVEIKAAEEVVLDNTIDSVKEFMAFAAAVNAGKSYAGETVTLGADLDLAGVTWTPIGTSANPFKGTFDGNGKVIKNLSVLMAGKNDVGLFGFTTDGEIKNVTVENAKIAGRLNVGVVAGTPYTSKYTNITVKGLVEVDGMAYVGGVAGKNAYADWTNVTVDVEAGSYVNANSVENGKAYRTYVGGVVGFNGEGGHSFTNITSNINVIGSTIDVGGAFGIAHYGNKFENITVTGNVTITNAAEAADAEEMGGIAGVWHNKTGYEVSFIDCVFNGKLTANVDADLSDNTITGKAYSATDKGTLVIINYETIDGVIYAIDGVTGVQALYMVPEDFTGDTVVVAEGTSKLTNYAFAYNNSVKTVILAPTVRDLGRGFDSAPSVEKVVLNEGLTTISSRAFKSTTALKEVVFSSTITEIADNAFQKSGIKEIVIPASVKTIGEAAFGSSLIETVTFEGDIAIQGYAFRGCTKLSTVNMNGYNVTFIPSTLNNRNSCWFCNGESNNPNTSNITFNVKTDVIKDRVLAAMGAEKNNTPVNVEMTDAVYVINAAGLEKAVKARAKAVILAEGDYALRFTNNTNFNLNDMTIMGLGGVNLEISSSEAWYGRVQGSNVTFENIHFTSSVGATGKATYNNCTFDNWTICASSNNEETTFNNCTINGCLNTSTDFSSGDVFVNNCKIAKAEYSGSMTMNFVDCQIGEIIIWNANTNLTNCEVTKLDDSNVTTATVTIK